MVYAVDTRTPKYEAQGRRILKAMERAGYMSQGDLAERIGRSQGTVSDIVLGKSKGREHLQKIADVLNVPLEWITTGEPRQSWEKELGDHHGLLVTRDAQGRNVDTRLQGWGERFIREEMTGGAQHRPLVPVATRSAGSVYLELPEPAHDGDRPAFRDGDAPREMALVGTVTAGDGLISYESEPRAFKLRPGWVVMRVEGSSAYPVVYPNQFVVVDLDRPVRHNNLVIVQTTDTPPRAFLKRWCAAPDSPEGYVLASVNSGIDSPYIPPSRILVMRPVVGVLFEE